MKMLITSHPHNEVVVDGIVDTEIVAAARREGAIEGLEIALELGLANKLGEDAEVQIRAEIERLKLNPS